MLLERDATHQEIQVEIGSLLAEYPREGCADARVVRHVQTMLSPM